MSVTQRVGVGQVELEDLKLANRARKKRRPVGSEYEQITQNTYPSSICYTIG